MDTSLQTIKASMVPLILDTIPKESKGLSNVNRDTGIPLLEEKPQAKVGLPVEIPTLDDMTQYLLSNEVIEKEQFPRVGAQSEKTIKIPEIVLNENEYENQSLSARTRDRSDSSGIFNQFNIDDKKNEIDSLYRMAWSLASNGDYQQAINYYNRIVGLNEKSGSAWIALGHCYAMTGQDHKALMSYKQALTHVPSSQKDEQLWYGIGLLYQKLEDWNSAEISFRNALRLDPKRTLKGEILYNLGMVMKAKGEYSEAVKYLTKCLVSEAFGPEKIVDILCQCGSLQEKINDLEGANKSYDYALLLQPNNPKALLCLGWLSFQLDKIKPALTYLKKAEQLLPNDSNITYLIARCLLKLKQHTEAYNCLHKCITKQPENHVYWSSLGILFGELTQLKQCYDSLYQAVKYEPKCPEHYFNLGCLFELSGQDNEALTMHAKALEIEPDFVLALNRKTCLVEQKTDSKAKNLEVQFKHVPFEFPHPGEIKGEQQAQLLQTAPQPDIKGTSKLKSSVTIEQSNAFTQKTKETKNEFLSSAQTIKIKQQAFSKSSFELKNKDSPDSDLTNLRLSAKQESNGLRLPSAQSLHSSISGVNSFSILQNNYNNVNNFVINPILNYPKDAESNGHSKPSPLFAARSKTEDSASSIPNEFAKRLGGLQAFSAQNNKNLQNMIIQNSGIEGLMAKKNTSSTIVLKHDPHGLSQDENTRQENARLKAQVEGKETRPAENYLEEEPLLQKKLKTESFNKVVAQRSREE